MELTELTLPIVPHKDIKTPKEQGYVTVKLLFRPGFLVRSRKSTSTFSAVGNGLQGVAKGGIGAVGAVGGGAVHLGGGAVKGVGSVGKGVGKGVGGVFKRVGGGGGGGAQGRRASNGDLVIPGTAAEPASANELQGLGLPIAAGSAGSSPPASAGLGSTAGTLTITIDSLQGAGDADEKKFIVVKSGAKTLKETKAHQGDVLDSIPYGETAVVKTTDGPTELSFSVV